MTTRLGEVLRAASDHLAGRGSETPRLDAELLLAHTLELSRVELYTEFDRPLNGAELDRYRGLIARRARHEPVAYLLGEWGFRRLTLAVDRRALIPRPETEVVVERALVLLDELGAAKPRVLDVGTGSGAIALAIADERHAARVTGIDASALALGLARENADRLGLEVDLREHDVLAAFPPGPWELVVSNPPYVDPEDLPALMPDVRDWEPHVALVGRGVPEAVARGAVEALVPGGGLVLEVGDGQAPAVAALLEGLGYRAVAVTRDLAGRERVVEGRR